jgi:hypothetical protein
MMVRERSRGRVSLHRHYHRWRPGRWTSRLSLEKDRAIRDRINELIDDAIANGKDIVTTSWMPGSDWTGTPFHPIYENAARCSELQAGMCFGLYVQDVIIHRPETWASEHFELHGRPIKGRTYFQVH